MTSATTSTPAFSFEQLFGKLSVPVLLVEDSSKVVALNEPAARLFKMSVEELLHQYWAGLDGQLNVIAWRKKLKELERTGVVRYETDLLTNDEFLRPVRVEMVPGGDGLTLLLLSNQLAEVIDEADLESLSEKGDVGFWMFNRVDDILYLSPHLRRLVDLPDELNTLEIVQLLQPKLLPADWERLREKMKSMLAEASAFDQVIHFEGKEGTLNLRFFAQSTGNALHVTRLFGMIRQENAAAATKDNDEIPGALAAFSIDQSTDLIFWTRPNGVISYANQSVVDLLGYSHNELIGMNAEVFTEGFTPEARDAWWDHLRKHKYHRAEWTVISRDGKKHLLDASVNYLRYGEEEYSCGFCRDITESSKRVRRSQLSEYTIDHSRDMVLWTRPGGKIVFANEPFLKRTEYDREEVDELSTVHFFAHVDEVYLNDFWDRLRAGEVLEGEISLSLRNGKTIPVQAKSRYLKFEGDEYNCIYLRDLSTRKKRDVQLKLSHEALDTAADCVVWLGGKYKIRYVNQTLLDLLGAKREKLIGQPYQQIFPLLEKDRIEQRKELTVTVVNAKREQRKLNLNSSVIQASGKQFYMLVGRDVTESDNRQRELEAAYEEITALKDRLEEDNINLREELNVKYNHNHIITVSPKYQKVLQEVGRVADVDTTVLITGETGTGKELLARSIHNLSERADGPLVKVNCAALPANLIESELFGHEKGAFTGAVGRKKGRFEMANKGTLFLDEVGELPLELQAKLLRVLQEDEFERLGGTETIKVDVRLVAATNRDLQAMVAEGTFRADLYYRLNVFPIVNLPLRDRPEDIPVLTEFFAKKFAKRQNKTISKISSADMKRLRKYPFPGNIRELENLVERAVVLCRSEVLSIPFDNIKPAATTNPDFLTLDEAQRQHIIAALRRTDGRVTGPKGAGIILGMNDRTLVSRMRKLNIKKSEYLS